MNYFRNLAVWFTQGIAVLSGIGLNPNETTSGAALRRRSDRPRYEKLYRAINRLFFWQKDSEGNYNHCERTAVMEAQDCVELLAAMGYRIEPPAMTVRQATAPKSEFTNLKTNTAESISQAQEKTTDDPHSPDFNAGSWFAALPDDVKSRITEWGVSISMSVPNRKKVARIAQAWHNADAVAREGHGMTE